MNLNLISSEIIKMNKLTSQMRNKIVEKVTITPEEVETSLKVFLQMKCQLLELKWR